MSENKLNDRQNEPEANENVGIFWIVVAFFINVLLWQPMKYLVKKAYKETSLTRAIAYSCFGALASITLGVLASYSVGWQFGHSALAWVPAGIFATFGSFIYLWCPLLIWVYRPLEDLSDWLWERVHLNSDSSFVPYRLRDAGQPGGDSENQPEKPELRHLTWFSYLLISALYMAGIAGFSLLGWSLTHEYLNAGPSWMSWAVWALCGSIAFCISSAGSYEKRRLYDRMKGICVLTGVLACYASAPFVSSLGLGGWSWAVYAFEFVVYCALVFPAIHTAVSECFYWAYKAVEKLADSTYSEPDRQYREFFGELSNVVIAFCVASWALTLATQLAWPLWALLATAAVAGILSYRVVGELISGGAFLAFVASSIEIGKGIWIYREVLHGMSPIEVGDGVWVGVTCAAILLALVVNFFLALPLAYIIGRFLSRDLLHVAYPIGSALKNAHSFVNGKFDALYKVFRKVYNETYIGEKENPQDRAYRSMFMHLLNVTQALVLSVAAAFTIAHFHAGVLGLSVAVASGIALVTFLYVVCGKILVEGGVKLVGNIVSIASAIALGAYIHLSEISGYGWAVGIVSYLVCYQIVFPLGYLGIAWVFNRGSYAQSLSNCLETAHGGAWARFLGGWMIAVRIAESIGKKIAAAWDKIRGKKN